MSIISLNNSGPWFFLGLGPRQIVNLLRRCRDGWARNRVICELILLPSEDRRDGIVPDRSDDDTGKASEPPDLVSRKDIAGDADIPRRRLVLLRQ